MREVRGMRNEEGILAASKRTPKGNLSAAINAAEATMHLLDDDNQRRWLGFAIEDMRHAYDALYPGQTFAERLQDIEALLLEALPHSGPDRARLEEMLRDLKRIIYVRTENGKQLWEVGFRD